MRQTLAAALLLLNSVCWGQDLQTYFTGSSIKFAYGGGTSANNPRVELIVHYCESGLYFSQGQSCRPNMIAQGYQCSDFQDAGQWAVQVHKGQASIHWLSQNTGPGWLSIYQRSDGVFVDQRNNPFVRMGTAICN